MCKFIAYSRLFALPGEISLVGLNIATNEIWRYYKNHKNPQTSASNERLILREQGERAKSVAKSLNGSLTREDSNAGALPSTTTNEIRATNEI